MTAVGEGGWDPDEPPPPLTDDDAPIDDAEEARPPPLSTNGHHPPEEEPATPTLTADQFTDTKGNINVPKLAEHVADLGHIRTGTDTRLYRYRRGVYLPDGDIFAAVTVRQILRSRWKARTGEEVVKWLRAAYPTITDQPPEQVINCTNGLLDWRTGTLGDHTPDIPSTIQLPIPWDPTAACPQIDQFLAETLPADAIGLALELIGLSLYPGNPFRVAMLGLGPSGTGKSKFLALAGALCGKANISTVPVQVLAENRFAAAELYGKLANISGDLDARTITRTDIFKMATGGDPIMAERKHGQPFSFTPFCTFLFAANEAPFTSDQTDAWFERWVVVPFENKPAHPDPHLIGRLTQPAELAGLLVHAVAGLRRLINRGHLDRAGSVDRAGAAYRDRLDSVRGYMADRCHLAPDAWTPRTALYKQYRDWCADGGRKPVSNETFYDHIRRNWPAEVDDATRKGTRGFSGIEIIGAEGADGPVLDF